jgi:ABC-type bacteriocin/lantibiotic exporter with double-glycine peptidase domain
LTIWIDEKADPTTDNDGLYRIVYIALCLLFLSGAITTSSMLVVMGTKSGKTLHHDVFTKVLGAPLSWHEENPSGRITSRFSVRGLSSYLDGPEQRRKQARARLPSAMFGAQ